MGFLREQRDKLELTCEELAKELEISKSYLYQMETGYRNPSWQMAVRLAEKFNCSLDEIYTDFKDKE